MAELLTGKEKIFFLPAASCKVVSLPVGAARYVSLSFFFKGLLESEKQRQLLIYKAVLKKVNLK